MGSPKGGTGKTTTAMLLTVALLKRGHRVGSIDLDGRQATLSQYLAYRDVLAGEGQPALERPRHHRIRPALRHSRDLDQEEERLRLEVALEDLADCDFIVIDTPGHDGHLARLACRVADRLVTPLNDSLLDLAVLARIEPRKRLVHGPSDYSRMIWEENDRRVADGRRPIDWIALRNRMGHVVSRNTGVVSRLLEQLAERLGFRLAEGLGERVIYRELFLQGLTPLDLPGRGADRTGSAARREVERLVQIVEDPPPAAARDPGGAEVGRRAPH